MNIVVKLQKNKDKKQVLKVARGKKKIEHIEWNNDTQKIEQWKQEENWITPSEC